MTSSGVWLIYSCIGKNSSGLFCFYLLLYYRMWDLDGDSFVLGVSIVHSITYPFNIFCFYLLLYYSMWDLNKDDNFVLGVSIV